MRHRQVIGGHVVAGEIEVDQPRHLVAQQQDVVGEQIGMDHRSRQALGPVRFEVAQFGFDQRRQRRVDGMEPLPAALRQQFVPVRQGHGIRALARKVGGIEMKPRQRLPHGMGLRRIGQVHRNARKEFDQRHRLAAHKTERRAGAIMDRAGNGAALGREMIQQAEEERQFLHRHAGLVHRQDEARAVAVAPGGFHQPVGIGHAFGNALGRNQRADIVFGHEAGKLGRGKRGVDGHFSIR